MLAPCSAAPVSTRPRIGPAQGAQSRPVATPSRNDGPTGEAANRPCEARSESRDPSATSGRVARSARLGNSNSKPKKARTTRAAIRPAPFACTAQPPPTAARLATPAKVMAMPPSKGRPLFMNGRSARAKTKGSTGRMHGLTMVSAPPR